MNSVPMTSSSSCHFYQVPKRPFYLTKTCHFAYCYLLLYQYFIIFCSMSCRTDSSILWEMSFRLFVSLWSYFWLHFNWIYRGWPVLKAILLLFEPNLYLLLHLAYFFVSYQPVSDLFSYFDSLKMHRYFFLRLVFGLFMVIYRKLTNWID